MRKQLRHIPVLFVTLLLLTACAGTPDSSADDQFLMEEPYSFSEVSPILGPGPFSVQELSETFSKPTSLYGYDSDQNGGYHVISVMFQDAKFDLAANHGETLTLISNEDGIYDVPDTAMDVQMEPQYVSIWGGDWDLPRGIKLGDSIESLYDAYNGNQGEERSAQGEFLVSYAYGESGSITYHFEDGITGGINQVTITWYSFPKPDTSSQSEKIPAPPA